MNKMTKTCLNLCAALILTLTVAFGMAEDEDIHDRFLKGKLIYKPNKDNDIGKMELRIADLANPLEGEFDLSKCGDAGQYLSINTGYRKGFRPENKDKVDIWFTPRFLADRELSTMAENHYLQSIITVGAWYASSSYRDLLDMGEVA